MLFALATTVALAVVAGVAYANSDSATTSVIRACRSKSSGLLRVLGPGANCHANETLLSWNVDGPAGAVGPTGPKGDGGATGAAGAAGPRGGSGANGTSGPAGPAGAQGLPGVAGPPGADGSNGVSVYAVQPSNHCATRGFDIYQEDAAQNNALIGPVCDGATGEAGAQGAQGAQGPAGAQGATGATGAAGATGPQGTHGDPGTPGAPGAAGAAGPQGPPGPQGDPGAGVQVTAFGTASPGPGETASLLVVPSLVTVDMADCSERQDGSYSSDISFTNTGPNDLWSAAGSLAAGATSGSELNFSIADLDATTQQPAHAEREFVDWETRTTISIYIADQPHSGSTDDNSLSCVAKAFAVIDTP